MAVPVSGVGKRGRKRVVCRACVSPLICVNVRPPSGVGVASPVRVATGATLLFIRVPLSSSCNCLQRVRSKGWGLDCGSLSVLASALRARFRFCWRFASVLTVWFVVGAEASSLRRIRRHHSPLRRQFFFFSLYRLRAKRKKYHGLTTIGFSATSGIAGHAPPDLPTGSGVCEELSA